MLFAIPTLIEPASEKQIKYEIHYEADIASGYVNGTCEYFHVMLPFSRRLVEIKTTLIMPKVKLF